MVTTRSSQESSRLSSLSSKANANAQAGTKRKSLDASNLPARKRGRPAKGKRDDRNESQSVKSTQSIDEQRDDSMIATNDLTSNGLKYSEKNAFHEVKADVEEVKEAAKTEQDGKSDAILNSDKSVIEDPEREATIPSSILEKGIIYFFFRGRVNITEPQGVEDIARSYIVLRPLPLGAQLGKGPLPETSDAHLLAVPKKVLPKSGKDRFLAFVEKEKASIKELREQFAGNEYATKTKGTSKTPAATPFAEGVYAITTAGRASHLAYALTLRSPEDLGEVQQELGLASEGSFIVSVKNPKTPSPANVGLDNPAEYPQAIQDKFKNLKWIPLEPDMLKYKNTQLLLIGEDRGNLKKSVKDLSEDEKDEEKETTKGEIEKLEKEDHERVKHLKEDDPVFADLGLSAKIYPHLQIAW